MVFARLPAISVNTLLPIVGKMQVEASDLSSEMIGSDGKVGTSRHDVLSVIMLP
jgi:hypothetical protein